jgi:hypothetical protein
MTLGKSLIFIAYSLTVFLCGIISGSEFNKAFCADQAIERQINELGEKP